MHVAILVTPWRWLQLGLELRFWVAGCVGGLASFSTRALGLAPSPTILALISCATLALYNLDGSLDAPLREQPRGRRRAHLVLTGLATVATAVLLVRLPALAALVTAAGFAVAAVYAVPLSAARMRGGAPKTWPGVKAPFVGVAVSTAVVFVPLLASTGAGIPGTGAEMTPQRVDMLSAVPLASALWLTLALALACTANALLFDLPDLDEDRRASVPTLARAAGPTAAKRAAGGLALLCAALGAFAPTAAEPASRLGLVGLGLALALASRRVHPGTSRAAVAVWVDGTLLLPALLQWLAS